MTQRTISLSIRAGETNCAAVDDTWQCPFLRRAVADMMAVCTLFPTNTTTSYTHLKVVEGWILRCEMCRKAEENEQPVSFRNATGLCPFCGVRIVTMYPPQEIPPTTIRCHACESELGPLEIRRAVAAYRADG
jgi:hypothetical protein